MGVIAVLMGLLVVGVRGALNSSRKLKESESLRSLAAGWTLRNQQKNGELMKGFAEMQPSPDESCATVFNGKDGVKLPWHMCATYPMRMLPFLDHQTSILWGHLDVPEAQLMMATATDWQPRPDRQSVASLMGKPGSLMALQPAFGYNAWFLGGWSERRGVGCVTITDHSRWKDKDGVIQTGGLVAYNLNHVRNPDKLIAFGSSSYRPRGDYDHGDAAENYEAGCAWITPPAMCGKEIWNCGGAANFKSVRVGQAGSESSMFAMELLQSEPEPVELNTDVLVVLQQEAAPVRRFTRMSLLMNVDASVSEASISELMDMRRWANPAWKHNFRFGAE